VGRLARPKGPPHRWLSVNTPCRAGDPRTEDWDPRWTGGQSATALPIVTHADPRIVVPELPPPGSTGRRQGENQSDPELCLCLCCLRLRGESVRRDCPLTRRRDRRRPLCRGIPGAEVPRGRRRSRRGGAAAFLAALAPVQCGPIAFSPWRSRRACGSPRGVASAAEECAPPQAAGSGRTLASRPARRGAAGVPLRRRRRDGGPAPFAPAGPSRRRPLSCPRRALSSFLARPPFGHPAPVLRMPALARTRRRTRRWKK